MLLAVSERPGRLPAMVGLRALALSLVFAAHFSGAYAYDIQRRTVDQDSFATLGSLYDLTLLWLFRSHYGVLLSFVISGFEGVTQVCLYAIACGVLLTKACFGTGWLNRFFSLTPLRLLGTVSYSFFLLHVIIIQLSFWFVNDAGVVPRDAAHSVALAIALGATTFVASPAAACILYIVAERPYFGTSVSTWRRQRSNASSAIAAVL